jgi:exodeoxyribonuclease VII large subunit
MQLEGSNFRIHTVEEITLAIKQKLTADQDLQNIWITGEISNFVHHTSGHFYFTMKDEGSQLSCAMFRWANEKLKFEPKNGMKVLVNGSIDVYTPHGRYNLVVKEVHPKGIGELFLKYLQLKDRLSKEGLFDVSYKKAIPPMPKKVGVITSPTGAAVKDIVNIMKRRFPLTSVLILPTLVQGDRAGEDIVRSITLLNKMENIDVAIVGRGGGSIEDLWCFNEEVVARAIFESRVPIISAVGHETDFTISDFVADLRAATPSAAAELVVPERNEVMARITTHKEGLYSTIQAIIAMNRKDLSGITNALKPGLLMKMIVQYQQQTDILTQYMITKITHNLEVRKNRFSTLCEMLDAVSPLATLKRGYSITVKLPDKSNVDSVTKAEQGDEVRVLLYDGHLECRIDEVQKNGYHVDISERKNGHFKKKACESESSEDGKIPESEGI